MRILLDQSAPAGLVALLVDHAVTRAFDLGWERLANGDLIRAAEQAGFQVVLTADKNLRYQQNLAGRTIALVVLEHSAWPLVRMHAAAIAAAIDGVAPGSYCEVSIPLPPKRPFPRH